MISDCRSRSGYDSSSGDESEGEYPSAYPANSTAATSNNQPQGKQISKGRWTKEEVMINSNNKFYLY